MSSTSSKRHSKKRKKSSSSSSASKSSASASSSSSSSRKRKKAGEGYSRKDKSLGLLCEHFVNYCAERCSADVFGLSARISPDTNLVLRYLFSSCRSIEVSLDAAARELGKERRRIYDLSNVLESFDFMTRSGTNQYHINNADIMRHRLKSLYEAVDGGSAEIGDEVYLSSVSHNIQSAFQAQQFHLSAVSPATNSVTGRLDSDDSFHAFLPTATMALNDGHFASAQNISEDLSLREHQKLKCFTHPPSPSDSSPTAGGRAGTGAGGSPSHAAVGRIKADTDARKEQTLIHLSVVFIQLFFATETRIVSLEDAAKCLVIGVVASGLCSSDHLAQAQSKFKSRVRRLYDIANVLCGVQLIEKIYLLPTRKHAFKWKGMGIFPLSSSIAPALYTVESTSATVADDVKDDSERELTEQQRMDRIYSSLFAAYDGNNSWKPWQHIIENFSQTQMQNIVQHSNKKETEQEREEDNIERRVQTGTQRKMHAQNANAPAHTNIPSSGSTISPPSSSSSSPSSSTSASASSSASSSSACYALFNLLSNAATHHSHYVAIQHMPPQALAYYPNTLPALSFSPSLVGMAATSSYSASLSSPPAHSVGTFYSSSASSTEKRSDGEASILREFECGLKIWKQHILTGIGNDAANPHQ